MTKAPRKKLSSRMGQIQPMPVRPVAELLEIRDQFGGSVILAALRGKLNAEEYLKLEQISEH